jgi:hypothetical protein
MTSKFCGLFLLTALIGLTGCALFNDRTPPEVVSVSPNNGEVNVSAGSTVSIVFSKSMERPVTESAFSLKKSGSVIEGFFSWSSDDKTMSFTPYAGLRRGGVYNVYLTSTAEDKNGIDLGKEKSFYFSTGADSVKPYVVSVIPVCGDSGVSQTTNVTLKFSRPIDPSSLVVGLVFSPSFDFSLGVISNGSTVVLTPVQPLQYGTTYFGTAGEEILDLSGNGLLEKYTFYFTVGQPMSNAAVLGMRNGSFGPFWSLSSLNPGVEKKDSIRFFFSRDMSLNGTSGYINFSPSIQGSYSWIGRTEAVFTPESSFALDQIYSVSISASMPDRYGNELGAPVSCSFKVNGTNSIPPQVICISNGPSSAWIDQQFISLNPDATITNMSIVFSSPMNETRTSLALTVEYVCGSGTTGVTINQIDWVSDDRILKLKIGGLDSGNTYRIRISSGRDAAQDRKGNWFLQDYIIHFRT